MKKILFTVFAVCIMFAASAQFKGGIKAGLNLANMTGDIEGADMLTSFHFGVYGAFGLTDAITLQPEVLYYGAGDKEGSDDIKLNYLAIPVMFKYGFADNKFNVQAGPQLALLLSTDPSAVKDILKSSDFGLNVGAGAAFGKLSIDARYSIGLANVVDVSGADAKNSVIQLSVGYQLFGE